MYDPIANIMELNRQYSELFQQQEHARRLHQVQHPTRIAVFKCMDGRVHAPTLTKTPLGILTPFRSMGGIFDLGWPAFQSDFQSWVERAISQGAHCVILVSYHFASGDKNRGCAGFGYDTEAARRYTLQMTSLLNHTIFHGQVGHAIQCGIDTDKGALMLHSEQEAQVLDLSKVKPNRFKPEEYLIKLFPNIPRVVIADLVPLVLGNLEHIQEVRRQKKRAPKDMIHREKILAVGQGFDWFNGPDHALIVGPYTPNLDQSIATAAELLLANIESGRIKHDKVVLLTCAPYGQPGCIQPMAEQRVRYLTETSWEAISKHVPKLLRHLVKLPVILDEHTRLIKQISIA